MSNGRKWIVAGAERICEQPISESECKWIPSSTKVVLKLQHLLCNGCVVVVHRNGF